MNTVAFYARAVFPLALLMWYYSRQLRRQNKEIEAKIMAKLDNLSANVTQNSNVIASAVTLLGNLKTELDAAIAADDDGAALQALSDTLGSSTATLAAAVAANTPAAAPAATGGAPDGATSSAHPANAPTPTPPDTTDTPATPTT